MKKYVDKDKLQEFTTKLTTKFKTMFALKGEIATDEQVKTAVDIWLDAHPEATTTVEDESITLDKFTDKVVDDTLGIINTASAKLITITDGADNIPFKSLITSIDAIQSGSGEPSSDNIRPITGNTFVNVNVSPTDNSGDGQTYKINFPAEAGTVYCGTLAIDRKGNAVLTVTHGIATYTGSENWKNTASGGNRYYLSDPYPLPTKYESANIKKEYYSSVFSSSLFQSSGNNGTWGHLVIGPNMIKLLDSQYNFENLSAFKQWLADINAAGTPFQLVYPLLNPITYKFTTNPIYTTLGTNNIWSDVGSTEVEYYADAKLYHENVRVPGYYLANNYLSEKISAIESAMEAAGGDVDTFFFLTDAHWVSNAKNSPALIKYISDRIPIPRLIFGGDGGEGVNLNFKNAFKKAYSGKIYMTIGNHEYHNYFYDIDMPAVSKTITETLLWNYYNSGMYDAVIGNAARNYYYTDNPVQKMRYIILNNYTLNSTEQFETEQQTWLANVALNMPDGYTALIFAHSIGYTNHTTGICAASGTGVTIASIADNYSGNGEIAALICGHRHFDGVGQTPGGIPIFVTTCDKYNYADPYDNWLSETRKKGTITEQAFDVFVIDKKNKKVTAVRIGCPADNPTGEPLEIREANYGTT